MDELLENLNKLIAAFPADISCETFVDEITIEVLPENLLELCNTLIKPPFDFAMLMDLCGIDYLHYGLAQWQTTAATSEGFSRAVTADQISVANEAIKTKTDSYKKNASDNSSSRFAVVYHLLSLKNNWRVRLHCKLVGDPPKVPTVIDIWQSANWYEREAFDMFGILFEGHPDLRRILTDYGFVGHPLRKDFPLTGEVEMRYDAKEQRVVYEPVEIEPRTLVPKVIRDARD